ncbi:unnamed protein product [Periconia digitata]|uniref:Uncharacterized protein n=1 Tax=Periconia digitata TaxID=1303443 RepID=A0A9W4XV52_9PLEO|nr:unnamed protein product [Periconia digitata]
MIVFGIRNLWHYIVELSGRANVQLQLHITKLLGDFPVLAERKLVDNVAVP